MENGVVLASGKGKRSFLLSRLALLALLVQCLLPVSHALAMSRASQDALFAQSICSYHEVEQDADQGGAAPSSSGNMLVCPMCQLGAMGNALALPTLSPEIVRLEISPLALGQEFSGTRSLTFTFAFDPSRPRGPPSAI